MWRNSESGNTWSIVAGGRQHAAGGRQHAAGGRQVLFLLLCVHHYDKSCHICILRLKRLSVECKKYGNLAMYLE